MNSPSPTLAAFPVVGYLQPTDLLICQFRFLIRTIKTVAAFAPKVDPLISRCQLGDKTAFRELFHRHRGDVGRIVQRMLGPVPEVEDIIQDVFIQVYRTLQDFQGNSKFSTWLYRVAVNTVLMHRRAQQSRPVLVAESTRPVPNDRLEPDEEAARRERIRAFYAVLDRLPEKKRTVFILHEIEGMNPKEIASLVHAPALTVRTRLFYARRDILRMMQQEPALASLASELLGSDDDQPSSEEES
ncbi:MAG TPA: RNA polymerase sigma factor [Polyangiaceae bacterium]|nr:MAG: ECF RNA polymerase sigma-E factor [Deltaproteobacteria bacterium ADurb.Bin207]HNS99102.1 RNA polymerase sigma factor [Polyangiaceae bacterium]HNZ21463.1 RNA polymerase sigma factor [Polyangiaceae bacterium]HOD23780.1 RNA polymerase sigma factor [Polyangiaceae bacterium]HOE51266.1 RNA polymerase sigma factor [Polyangiaceae bacterium]